MTTTLYEALGGEAGVQRLVDRFYELKDTLPEAYASRRLHPESLAGSNQKLFMFLSGWLGGPQLFIEAFGHPRLRARHLPYQIGVAERDAWMLCMTQTLQEQVADDKLRAALLEAFAGLADHMRNTAE